MITRYSPIAPIQLLEDLFSRGLLGNYLLLLAHDVLLQPNRYTSLMDAVHAANEHSMIIMDNSVVELGAALDLNLVIEAADIVGANCIVAPDVLGSFSGTQKVVEKERNALMDSMYPIMRIPQGRNREDLMRCIEWLRFTLPLDNAQEEPELWGIPRWIANEHGSRKHIVEYISRTAEVPNIGIHLLGMSSEFADDMHCANMPDVMGIDSANPLVLGMHGHDIEKAGIHLERGDYWHCKELNNQMILNVEWMYKNVGT